MIELRPQDELEERVFNLLLQDKIPGLSGGHFFQGDYYAGDIREISKPDIVYFKQVEENQLEIYPYDVKSTFRCLQPKQISPLTLKILDSQNSFHTRLMNALEEYGWQNMEYKFKEGAMLVNYPNYAKMLTNDLGKCRTSAMVRNMHDWINLFNEKYGMYTIDTVVLKKTKIPNADVKSIKQLDQLLLGIDFMHPKETATHKIIYSASEKYGSLLRSKQILVKECGSYVITYICPYILLPESS